MKHCARWIGLAALVTGLASSCGVPECSRPDYRLAECRVILENDLARLRTLRGTEIRFQDPGAPTAESWEARGLLAWREAGVVEARVAGLGAFAISVQGDGEGLTLALTNVDPRLHVQLVGMRGSRDVPPMPQSLERRVELSADDGPEVWIRGSLQCAARYRLAVTADIQTHPGQFQRILDRLHDESAVAEAAGEPLMGLVVAGDLTEWSRDDEFDNIARIMSGATVPVVTIPGNHDTFEQGRPFYHRRFGPGNHRFTICDAQVVLLDSGSGTIAASVEGRLPEMLGRGGARHLLLGMHHPPYPGVTGAGWTNEERAHWLLAEAAIAGVDLIFTGHKHELRSFKDINVGGEQLWEIIVGTAGADQGIGFPRYGYVRLTLDPAGISACFVEVPVGDAPEVKQGGVPGLDACKD